MAKSPHQRLGGATKLRMIERDTHIDTEVWLPVSGKEQVKIDQKKSITIPRLLVQYFDLSSIIHLFSAKKTALVVV
jgi:hypothetical protein